MHAPMCKDNIYDVIILIFIGISCNDDKSLCIDGE